MIGGDTPSEIVRHGTGELLIYAPARRDPLEAQEGAGFDIAMANHDRQSSGRRREVGFLGFGFYPSGFMRIDLDPARQWGGALARTAGAVRTRDPAGARASRRAAQ